MLKKVWITTKTGTRYYRVRKQWKPRSRRSLGVNPFGLVNKTEGLLLEPVKAVN